jgi:hypothetical protein
VMPLPRGPSSSKALSKASRASPKMCSADVRCGWMDVKVKGWIGMANARRDVSVCIVRIIVGRGFVMVVGCCCVG